MQQVPIPGKRIMYKIQSKIEREFLRFDDLPVGGPKILMQWIPMQ